MKFLGLIVLLSTSSLLQAEEYKASNKLLECAAVFGWLSRHGNSNEKKDAALEWTRIYYGSAVDLSSKEYALSRFKEKVNEFKLKLIDTRKSIPSYAESEVIRCSNIRNLGDDVATELQSLIDRKKSN